MTRLRRTAGRPRFHATRAGNLLRLAIATAAALAVAATLITLAIAAMDSIRWDPRATVGLTLAAMWIPMALLYAQITYHRRRERR